MGLNGLFRAKLWRRFLNSPAQRVLFFFFFDWRIITLYYFDGFCYTSTWINHRYTYVPSLYNLPPTFLPIPPLWIVTDHQLWAPCIIQQIPTGYLFYIGMYMFQYDSLKSSHPLPPQLWSLVCSLCLSLLCCHANRTISTIFLDSVYMH